MSDLFTCAGGEGDREKELHRLLEQCLRRGEEDPYRSIDLPRRKTPEREVAPEVSLELRPEFSDLKEAYACLCQLLVELSSFPASLATLKTILLVEVPGTGDAPSLLNRADLSPLSMLRLVYWHFVP